jgi:hypothetical protein
MTRSPVGEYDTEQGLVLASSAAAWSAKYMRGDAVPVVLTYVDDVPQWVRRWFKRARPTESVALFTQAPPLVSPVKKRS